MKLTKWIACALVALTMMASCAYKTCPTYAQKTTMAKKQAVRG
ncbi:MAG: hypothetical protein RMJ44_06065 [Cytophagales bacterium]|nr:hypothetical protein [Bernardetiaceae bacterium]MDW8210634.1 hypothetical protein [Cytophagales bacterium]